MPINKLSKSFIIVIIFFTTITLKIHSNDRITFTSSIEKNNKDCILEINNVQLNPGISYSFNVDIKRNDPPWSDNTALGVCFGTFNSTLVFKVTENAFSNPVTSNHGNCINGTIDTLIAGKLIQIELLTSETAVDTTLQRLMTVTLDIEDPSTTSGLKWDSLNTVIFKSDNWSSASIEFLGSDNTSLPVDPENYEHEIERNDILLENKPNPFNPKQEETKLFFELKKMREVSLKIFNCRGQLVKTIYRGFKKKGSFDWKGRDNDGNIVKNGIYFLSLKSKEDIKIKKVVIISDQ